MYVSCSKSPGTSRASGSCPFTVPSTLAPGNYQLRLLANNGYTLLAGTNAFTVGAGAAGSLQFSLANYSVAENGGNATITITRTGGSAGAVGVTFCDQQRHGHGRRRLHGATQTVSFANGDTANKTVPHPDPGRYYL